MIEEVIRGFCWTSLKTATGGRLIASSPHRLIA